MKTKSIKGTERTWISMQRETFMNWININLGARGMAIEDIETAFEDGVKLVNLFEVISKKKLTKYNKNPKFPNQKMENVTLVLSAMEEDGLKTVSIDSDHVVNGNGKMILGLIWQLILRYQVGGSEDDSIKVAVKKLLLVWLQHVIPEQGVTNLTNHWTTGIALCNLLDVLQPGLCPEYRSMCSNNAMDNIVKGLTLAEEAFGIPRIISAENMASRNVDELSMTTYLSYFIQDGGIGEQWTRALIEQWNPDINATNFNSDWNDGRRLAKLVNTFAPGSVSELTDDDVQNCEMLIDVAFERLGIDKIVKPEEMANPKIPEIALMAYLIQFRQIDFIPPPPPPLKHVREQLSATGPGLTEAIVSIVNEFQVMKPPDICLEDLSVEIVGEGHHVVAAAFEDVSPSVRLYQYSPVEDGNCVINITYEGEHISHSPYSVECIPNLWKEEGDTSPGSQLFAEVNEKIGIVVDTFNAKGEVTATTVGPGDVDVPTEVERNADEGNSMVCFKTQEVGEYLTKVFWRGKEIMGSPFKIWVIDSEKCILGSSNVYEGTLDHSISFVIWTTGAGPGVITCRVEHEGEPVDCEVVELAEACFCCSFTPTKGGVHMLHVQYNESTVPKSPFRILIGDPKNIIVTIDNELLREPDTLQSIIIELLEGISAEFLKCVITGPDNAEVPNELKFVDEGKYSLCFTPLAEGRYLINIYYFTVLVQNCPHVIEVSYPPLPNPPLVEETNLATHLYAEVNEEIGISIDTTKTGEGKLVAITQGPEASSIPTEVTREENGTSTISFTPLVVGMYQTNVYWNNKELPGSPFRICINDFSKCVRKDATILEGLLAEDMLIEVTVAGAGPGTLTAHAQLMEETINVRVIELENDCYCCSFNPSKAGEYLLHINYNETAIGGSPFKIIIIDLRDINLSIDNNSTIETLILYEFTVQLPEGASRSLTCFTDGPNEEKVPTELIKDDGGLHRLSFLPSLDGSYRINLFYASAPLVNSPYVVNAATPIIASKVLVSGEGLTEAFLNEECLIDVDGRNAGPGQLSASIQGEKLFVVVGIREVSDGIYVIAYTPPVIGSYLLTIMWSDEHVDGSPFNVQVQERPNPENLLVGGEGLKEGTAGQPVLFTLDGRSAGPGALSCRCRAPSGKMTFILISDNQDGTYTVDLNATEPGLHTVEVEWDGEAIPGSPFLVRIMQAPDVKKVRAHGPGLLSGVIDHFNGIFYVDTKGGGPGALKVRVHGPKECFKVQMYRNEPKDRVINVKYNPTIPGIYTVNVLWSDEHVEGSPFEVFIAANEDHLERWNKNREGESSH